MTQRYEIKAWRESSQGKPYTVRIGSAWVDQKGITRLAFDALPIPDKDGKVQCFLDEPRDRDAVSSRSEAPPAADSYAAARGMTEKPTKAALEDEIPF